MSQPYEGDSTNATIPGIKGTNTATATGGQGVFGESLHWEGVRGVGHAQAAGVAGLNLGPQGAAAHGVYGESQHWEGVHGIGHGQGAGVAGFNDAPDGVAQPGVWGESQHWEGVHGVAHNKGAGVAGFNLGPPGGAAHGVWGESQNWEGVHGTGHGQGAGVAGFNDAPPATAQPGVWGESQNGEGVHGVTHSSSAAAIAGIAAPGGNAGYFQGNVTVTGDVLLTGADCAEDFDVASVGVEPGTVMVLSDQEGLLHPSEYAYDKRVAGVISGAGNYKPGITLDRRQARGNRMPMALVGKVYCKVDASVSPIEIGDLLTTSSTPGHAMKASDPLHAFGAVLGKALGAWRSGTGLIPVLVALQ